MAVSAASLVAGSLALTVLALLVRRFLFTGKSLPRPPGPKGWPIIGNVLQMPHDRLWEKAVEWGETYGDIVYLENFGKPMLIINKYETAVELLSARSSKYSSRPPFVMAELEGWDLLTAVLPYGDRLKKQRAYQHRFLNSLEVVDYSEIQLQETQVLLQGLLSSPTEYPKHIKRLIGASVMRNFYGHKVLDENDPYVQLSDTAIKSVTDAEDYLFLDSLPWLRHLPDWLPWIEFPRVAKEVRKVSHAVVHDMARKMTAEHSSTPSMMSILVSENTKDDGTITDEEEIGAAAVTLYVGGVDSSVTALMTFVLAMLKYPEVQERARSEVLGVVGEHRLPTFEDIGKLQYVQAVCKEVLRWQSIGPLLIAHYSTEDDEYNGYLIPAGTTILPNAWAMSRNPFHFPDATVFRPERWLEPTKKQGISRPPEPGDFVFGFGRRSCPGQKWAEQLLSIAVASMLAAFKFDRKYKDGVPVPLHEEYEGRFLWQLAPSECNITPRSEVMGNLIQNAEIY